MPISAGLLNRKAAFRRRAPLPAQLGAARGSFDPYGAAVWAAYTERRPRDLNASGLTLTARTATLAIRDSAWAQTIQRSDRVAIDGDVFDVTANAIVDRRDGVLRFELVEAITPAMYAREMEARGDVVLLKRGPLEGPGPSAQVRAVVMGYEPQELTGNVQQGDSKVIFMADDLGDFPLPIKSGSTDAIWQGNRKMTVQAVDDQTRRVAGVLIAYELRVRG